jgi:hypothetical protein
MLPFEPETIERLRARYPKAIKSIWHADEVTTNHHPGGHREHVFDFESGLRLLISRDILADEEPLIHISASWHHSFPTTILEAIERIGEAIHLLEIKVQLTLIGSSIKGVLHFVEIKNARPN